MGKGKPTVMLAGHCDEVGFMVQYIDESGFLYSLKDLEATCQLLVGFIYELEEGMSFIPK